MKFWSFLGWAACLILVVVAVLALLNPAQPLDESPDASPHAVPPPIPVFR